MKTVIVDLDGTLADNSDRQHWVAGNRKNWPRFFEEITNDKIVYPVLELIKIFHSCGFKIVVVTGRPEEYRDKTVKWMIENNIDDFISCYFFRNSRDFREDQIVKRDILSDIRRAGFDPKFAIEDRIIVSEMWKSEGLFCLNVVL